jgi:hypothetical protein
MPSSRHDDRPFASPPARSSSSAVRSSAASRPRGPPPPAHVTVELVDLAEDLDGRFRLAPAQQALEHPDGRLGLGAAALPGGQPIAHRGRAPRDAFGHLLLGAGELRHDAAPHVVEDQVEEGRDRDHGLRGGVAHPAGRALRPLGETVEGPETAPVRAVVERDETDVDAARGPDRREREDAAEMAAAKLAEDPGELLLLLRGGRLPPQPDRGGLLVEQREGSVLAAPRTTRSLRTRYAERTSSAPAAVPSRRAARAPSRRLRSAAAMPSAAPRRRSRPWRISSGRPVSLTLPQPVR